MEHKKLNLAIHCQDDLKAATSSCPLNDETALNALEDTMGDDKASLDLHSEIEAFEDKNDIVGNNDKNEITPSN